MHWDDVDRMTGELRLRDAKAGPRMVPLTAPAKRVLEGIPRSPEDPWVISRGNGNGRPLNLSY